jgi:3'(2'), 5'-bisphosphate nucleotidase
VSAPVGDAPFARWLAGRAGDQLRTLRDERGFDDPGALRDAGDKRAHDLLVEELRRWRPDDAVLSEEGVRDDPARQSAERVWIVDPLDGTREFGEPGRADWAVHVALWSRGAGGAAGLGGTGLVAAAVALPAQPPATPGEAFLVLGTDQPPAYPAPPGGDGGAGRPLLAVSRTRPPAFLAAVADEVGGELVPMGSAGAKIAAVVTGEVDAYLHAGGQYEWDSAAPVAVALATGLHASRIDGSTLEYNRVDPRLPDLLVCRRELTDRLLAAVARHAPEK